MKSFAPPASWTKSPCISSCISMSDVTEYQLSLSDPNRSWTWWNCLIFPQSAAAKYSLQSLTNLTHQLRAWAPLQWTVCLRKRYKFLPMIFYNGPHSIRTESEDGQARTVALWHMVPFYDSDFSSDHTLTSDVCITPNFCMDHICAFFREQKQVNWYIRCWI